MYYSAIGLLAVLELIIVNWDILIPSNKPFMRPAWKTYRRFLFAVLAYYVTDILWGIFESRKMAGALFVDTTIYYVAMSVGILFWAEYTIAYQNENSSFGRFFVIAGRVIAGAITTLVLVNVFKPILFTVDKKSVYHALPPRYVMLVCQILLLLAISVYALSSLIRLGRDAQKHSRFRILASFGLIMALFLFLQLWFPYLPLYSIAYMLGTSMLHSFVADDEKEEYRREQEETNKITELKDRFKSLLDNMPGMTFTKDAETGIYLACNQAFADYAQKESPDRVIGLSDAQIFDAKTADHFVAADQIALSLSKPYVFFEDVADAAGNQRQLQTTKIKYVDTAGRLCVLGICQDITDMVRIQHEQAMTKEAYEQAVSSGLMYTHIAQTLARDYADMYYVNTDTEEFIEYQHGEEGDSLIEVRRGWHFFSDCKTELSEKVFEEDREAFLQAMNRKALMKALIRKNTFVMTFRMMGENGFHYVTMKISRMEDEHFVIMGITDVDAKVHETMARNRALAEALDLAEQANKAKTIFLSGMSHELRAPMNAIIGLNALALKRENLDSETRKYLKKIEDSSKHLLSIINDILDMSRIESGRVIMHAEEFSLEALLEQINVPVQAQCNEKGLKYECRILKAGGTYYGDDGKIKEMLTNVLSNAVKFTEAPGSVQLVVEKTAENEEQAMLCFRIKDTGIGMDKDYLPKIFDAFSQENAENRTKYGSSGLGMAITKRIVEMMNGSISVTSKKGVGTEFVITVSLEKCDQKSGETALRIDPASLYVLVVDDDPIEAEHARMVLEEVGIRADACTSGQEALRKMEVQHGRQEFYNFVLMDWNMPGMNGKETSVEIQKLYRNECTIIALTAYNWEDIQEEARLAGVDNFLAKPLFATSIIENIEQIARRSKLSIFKEKAKAKLAGRRILLAEDTEINAEILTDVLEMDDVKVDHAVNGKIAVEMFEKSTAGIYSAILMDVRMPVMNGLEAAAAIRAMDREDAARIPIIALTANAFDEDVQCSLQAGMNAHLSKPVEAENLIRILGELIYEAENKI